MKSKMYFSVEIPAGKSFLAVTLTDADVEHCPVAMPPDARQSRIIPENKRAKANADAFVQAIFGALRR